MITSPHRVGDYARSTVHHIDLVHTSSSFCSVPSIWPFRLNLPHVLKVCENGEGQPVHGSRNALRPNTMRGCLGATDEAISTVRMESLVGVVILLVTQGEGL